MNQGFFPIDNSWRDKNKELGPDIADLLSLKDEADNGDFGEQGNSRPSLTGVPGVNSTDNGGVSIFYEHFCFGGLLLNRRISSCAGLGEVRLVLGGFNGHQDAAIIGDVGGDIELEVCFEKLSLRPGLRDDAHRNADALGDDSLSVIEGGNPGRAYHSAVATFFHGGEAKTKQLRPPGGPEDEAQPGPQHPASGRGEIHGVASGVSGTAVGRIAAVSGALNSDIVGKDEAGRVAAGRVHLPGSPPLNSKAPYVIAGSLHDSTLNEYLGSLRVEPLCELDESVDIGVNVFKDDGVGALVGLGASSLCEHGLQLSDDFLSDRVVEGDDFYSCVFEHDLSFFSFKLCLIFRIQILTGGDTKNIVSLDHAISFGAKDRVEGMFPGDVVETKGYFTRNFLSGDDVLPGDLGDEAEDVGDVRLSYVHGEQLGFGP